MLEYALIVANGRNYLINDIEGHSSTIYLLLSLECFFPGIRFQLLRSESQNRISGKSTLVNIDGTVYD